MQEQLPSKKIQVHTNSSHKILLKKGLFKSLLFLNHLQNEVRVRSVPIFTECIKHSIHATYSRLQSHAIEIQILASFRKTRTFIQRRAKTNPSYRTHSQKGEEFRERGESATGHSADILLQYFKSIIDIFFSSIQRMCHRDVH